jgi:hypothetical protein
LALLTRQAPAENPPVLLPAGGGVRSTNTRLVTDRAVAPPAAAVTLMVAHPGGARAPPAVRPFQRTLASDPVPVKERTVAPLDPVTATRQRTLELKRAWTPA